MLNGAQYENLNPLSFLQRSAIAYPDKTAIVYNDQKFTYSQFHERVKRAIVRFCIEDISGPLQ